MYKLIPASNKFNKSEFDINLPDFCSSIMSKATLLKYLLQEK